MRLLFVGNFNVTRGTGYATILENICSELAGRHTVTVLATNWDRSEHHYPFQAIPSHWTWIPAQVERLQQALQFDHVILAMDIPKIEQILVQVEGKALKWPRTSAIFPIESDPLVSNWGASLMGLHRRFVISEFGQRELARRGLDSTWLPMTARIPGDKLEIREAREKLGLSGGLIALTVADNQERKDLPVIARALAHLREYENVRITWALVTDKASPYGWKLDALLEMTTMSEQTVIFDSLSPDELAAAYQAADWFILASQAEGACLPLYEAMAHDLFCVAPRHTAITEALEGRGALVEPSRMTIHPFGCVHRYHVDPIDLGEALNKSCHPGNGAMLEFIEGRPWSLAAGLLEGALK